MPILLKKGNQGSEVKEVQTLLINKGILTNEELNGIFDNVTYRAVRAFQAQNLDQHGQPLKVDGQVGELTWWSLHNPKPFIVIPTPNAVKYTEMPEIALGGSQRGRAALQTAINELKAGAGEIGGNNMGPFVKKYLHGIVPEGNPWCAGFVSYCFSQNPAGIPFPYTFSARIFYAFFKIKVGPINRIAVICLNLVMWWCGGAINQAVARGILVWCINCGMVFYTPLRVIKARMCRALVM